MTKISEKVEQLEKDVVKINTRLDEKFTGIDGRLKGIDIQLENLNTKFTTLLYTLLGGVIMIAGLVLSGNAKAADTNITTTTTSTSTNTNNTTSSSTMDYKNQPVQRANAPNVTVTNNDVCVAGVSGGAQGNAIGISFGATVTDPNCERIKLARELRNANMKVASVAILCQDPRVFQAMIDSGTPCPFKGLIGDQARDMWNKYPELRADYADYLKKIDILVQAGYMDKDGNMLEKAHAETDSKFKSSSDNWN